MNWNPGLKVALAGCIAVGTVGCEIGGDPTDAGVVDEREPLTPDEMPRYPIACVTDLDTGNTGTINERVTASFNANDQVTNRVVTQTDGTIALEEVFVYDTDGRLERQIQTAFGNTSTVDFEYDDDGRVTSETVLLPDPDVKNRDIPVRLHTFYYDNASNLLLERRENLQPVNGLPDEFETVTTFDSDNRPVTFTTDLRLTGVVDRSANMTFTNVDDGYNQTIMETFAGLYEGTPTWNYNIEFRTVLDSDVPLRVAQDIDQDGDGVPNQREERTYDERFPAGHLWTSVAFDTDFDGETDVLLTRELDDDGNTLVLIRDDVTTGETTTRTYDYSCFD